MQIKMSCIENSPPVRETEMEEGEIVDELDDLSDISSEEEYLLRQRLQVLESYNNVLERKEAKRSHVPDKKENEEALVDISELSDISYTAFDEAPKHKSAKRERDKSHHKSKRKKEQQSKQNTVKPKDTKRKPRVKKQLQPTVIISESSEDSDYEYRNKRRKLADAVSINKKTDTSLKDRLMNMMIISRTGDHLCSQKDKLILMKHAETFRNSLDKPQEILPQDTIEAKDLDREDVYISDEKHPICVTEKDVAPVIDNLNTGNNVDIIKHNENSLTESNDVHMSEESNDDLESLRQHALNSKVNKQPKGIPPEVTTVEEPKSDDEDSDTAELRLICLRSTILKKAIEMKQKQRLRKRLSQSTSLYDEIIQSDGDSGKDELNNNTDIESVDMDIGSDHDNKDEPENIVPKHSIKHDSKDIDKESVEPSKPNIDDLEEDEDLLRAKLLTSLSKNLFVEADQLNVSIEDIQSNEKADIEAKKEENNIPENQRFIINTADSDSGEEHEATKSLTKMHARLSDSVEFQQKLDSFLKSTRLEVEKRLLPDLVKKPAEIPIKKTPEKFVPKTVNHLPKSEQLEYRNLVKRMAELEKIKQARLTLDLTTQALQKDALKPRNVIMHNNSLKNSLEDQIAMSRKKIAEESSKVLKLKDEGQKLIQKYKVMAAELRNLSTAISYNKKEQKFTQIKLSKMRSHHQNLLKRSNYNLTNIRSNKNTNTRAEDRVNNLVNTPKQKENELEHVSKNTLQSMRVSVFNDLQEQFKSDHLSVKLDLSTNKKIVSIQNEKSDKKIHSKDSSMDTAQDNSKKTERQVVCDKSRADDYKSPLDALVSSDVWNEDPNGVLCPFEVSGSCKDANCKYLHPKIPLH